MKIKLNETELLDIYNNKLNRAQITKKYGLQRWQAERVLNAIHSSRLPYCDYEWRNRVNSPTFMSEVQKDLSKVNEEVKY